jgi:minor tail protein Z (GPZ)
MAEITVRLNTLGLDDALRNLGKNAIRAQVRALNRTIMTVKTRARRALAEKTNVAQKAIEKILSVQKATFSRPEAVLRASGTERIPLYAFTRQRKKRGRPTGLGDKPGSFIATMRSGHTGIYRVRLPALSRAAAVVGRKLPRSSPQLHIFELFGPSLPRVFANDLIDDLTKDGTEELLKNLRHEVRFLESKLTA